MSNFDTDFLYSFMANFMNDLTPMRPVLEMTFTQLPEFFFSTTVPTPVADPTTLLTNHSLAKELGINTHWLDSEDACQVLSGNAPLASPQSIASAYAGHQFGHLNPQLGDGRAHLLGEIVTPHQQRFDVQLKGSGTTPYSRQGDGHSPLGPVLREYIVSEAMYALGVPTSRSLAAVATGQPVYRNQGAEPGAILTRIANSHIRVGSFTFAALQGAEYTQALADYCLVRHFLNLAEAELPYLHLLEAVISRQAKLIAKWMSLGFIHGVMNTDNMLICGQTIDYGPCAFLDTYIPDKTFSFIDREGRYRYNNQPAIGQWNLVRLAEALLPIMGNSTDAALPIVQEALNHYQQQYNDNFNTLMAKKTGFVQASSQTIQLIDELLNIMTTRELDFTLTFRYLMSQLTTSADTAEHAFFEEQLFAINGNGHEQKFSHAKQAVDSWVTNWLSLLSNLSNQQDSRQLMAANNPIYIPRNHLVEQAIQAAYEGDMTITHNLLTATRLPYEFQPSLKTLAIPPLPEEVVKNTFCGT